MAGFPQPTARRLRFGVFELDVCSGELHKNGWKVKLEGQPLALLALLLQRAGELVGREEVRWLLWPSDTYVDYEHSINAAVKRLRRALDDCARTPRFIETLPRRGYRFIYPVGEKEAARVDRNDAPPGQTTNHPERAEVPDKILTIGETARRFGVTPNVLRMYEQEGLLLALRDGNGRRHFTPQDLRTSW